MDSDQQTEEQMHQRYPDCMVDLETTGISPDRAGIIQIAAVRFNFETGGVDHDFFNMALMLPPWRHWQEDTRNWWLQQKQSVLQEILVRAVNPHYVMNEFVNWCVLKGQMRLWAKPVSFEYPFIQSYCGDYELPMPFHYRTAIDCRSFATGLAYPNDPVSEKDVEFDGDEHNALYDVLHQIKWMLKVRDSWMTRDPLAAPEPEPVTV